MNQQIIKVTHKNRQGYKDGRKTGKEAQEEREGTNRKEDGSERDKKIP